MAAPKEVVELVERFRQNFEAYKSGSYNETQLRREFLDPFFEILGWDVSNKRGYADAYKDVIHEDTVKVGGATKAPDYGFCIGGTRKFFLEAKQPSVNIKGDIHPAYQLRRYAWSAKLPLSILSDFEEFAVYDCRIRPVQTDGAAIARVLYFNYTEYEDRWDEIESIFSHESVLKGSFDKYAESTKAKKGTAEVDDAFLKEIESWRNVLARNLALRNPTLTQRELNFAVGRTIDRIIFLRICEDRGVEDYGQLMALQNGTRIYARLRQLFHRADDRYNSGLFHFKAEKDRSEPPDDFTLNLTIDDKPLKDIFKSLYYPDSPYEFSVLSADILGQVYEQFLGKVIRLTPSHRAVVEDKPEVKKAGGVYYTPTYIVNYIVENTVGELLKGKTLKQVEKLKILDPACGSGSFLIGAYQYLLDWHYKFYLDDGPEKWMKGRSPALYQGHSDDNRVNYHLTTAERKRILLNNIYGVDIDSQAVEVTKLSLLLKVLEGENEQTLMRQIRLFQERALPDLGNNIKCGNSLIGSDFYAGQQMSLLDEEERYRINVFDWETEFSEIMKGGGFDAVIGNPPYVLLQSLGLPEVFSYLSDKFESARYKIDTYHLFTEQAWRIANEGGFIGYITPNTFLRNKHAITLRALLLRQSEIKQLALFDYSVFDGASVDTSVILFKRSSKPLRNHQVIIERFSSPIRKKIIGNVKQADWLKRDDLNFDLPEVQRAASLLNKLHSHAVPLGEFATAYFGIQTHSRKKFVSKEPIDSSWKPALDGGNINRYSLNSPVEYVNTNPTAIKSGGKVFVYEQARIGVRQIGKRPIATLLPGGWYSLNTIYNIYFTKSVDFDIRFILGLIASNLFGWYWEIKFFDQKRTFPKIKKTPLLSLPIQKLDFSQDSDKAQHDQMVDLVDQMLSLNRQLTMAKMSYDKTAIQRQIDATDQQIDRLVYDLYGLTEEEIKIVEETNVVN